MQHFLSSPNYDFSRHRQRMIDGLNNALEYLSEELSIEKLKCQEPTWPNYRMYNRGLSLLEGNQLSQGIAALRAACQQRCRSPLSVRAYRPGAMTLDEISLIQEALALNADRISKADFLYDEKQFQSECSKINEALDIMKAGVPCFYEEARTYTDEIILTSGEESGYMRSGSAFNLYGIVMLMADETNTPLFYVEHIVHEVGHITLSSVNSYDELTLNELDERYKAPLRSDLRPMPGLYQAAFVLCRIFQAFYGLRGKVDSKYRDELHRRLDVSVKRFNETALTIDTHGRLTPLGREILDGCKETIEGLDLSPLAVD